MDDILERVGYPSAPLTKAPRPPLAEGELAALVDSFQAEPIFRGAWTIGSDLTPVAILHAFDAKHFRAAASEMTGVLIWNWPGRFGRLTSFSCVVPGERSPRMFLPDDSAFVRAVLNTGRLTVAACWGQRLSPFYCADFTKHPEHPDMLEAVASVLRFENDPNLVFRDDELAIGI